MTTSVVSLLGETLPLAVTEQGSGQPYLLLHGGAGPGSLQGLATALAATGRVVLPTHPGFAGQPRPAWFRRVDDLVLAYLALLERLDLHQVVVVGNSVGGWLAAELGLRASPRVAALVLLDAVGLEPNEATGPIIDPTQLAPAERGAYAFHDPARFAAALASADATTMAANQQALRVYAGEPFMYDPTLRTRLPELSLPTLVLWGESDRIVTPTYGRELAGLIPAAHFEVVAQAGHFPQVEQLDQVTSRIQAFQARYASAAS